MALDVRMERWIKTSINKYFDDGKGSFTLILEGDPTPETASWCELRLNGPRYHEISKDFYRAELEINLAFNLKQGSTSNLYQLEEMVGHFRTLCEGQIQIKKFKDGEVLINCLRLRDNVSNPIEVVPWGEVNVQGASGPVRVFLTSIDGYYRLEINQ